MPTLRRLPLLPLVIIIWLIAADVARAEWNSTSIAVPLIGTSGVASPYPSRITAQPNLGVLQRGEVTVRLFGVTHPCADDLAILLVHNDTEKYLLMSRAGGCRALRAAEVWFQSFPAPLPDEDPGTLPYPLLVQTRPANYGPEPVFPAPAPAGPYQPNLPPPTTTIAGTWDLYVMDLNGTNRGVIAGGWSITYGNYGTIPSAGTPALIPDLGPAAPYPITFDLSQASPEAVARYVHLELAMSHGYADDLRVVLQSPAGTAVMVMANAGGDAVLASSTIFRFEDDAPFAMPNAGPIPAALLLIYRPSMYGGAETESLPSPAPPAPYATTLAAFIGQAPRGIWKLWVFDDLGGFAGSVASAQLSVGTDIGSATLTLIAPTTEPTYTATQPFVRVVGLVGNVNRPFSATWDNAQLGAAGAMTVTMPGGLGPLSATVQAEVPLQKGLNRIAVHTVTSDGFSEFKDLQITVNEFTYSLSEGATGGFFDEDVTLGNATDLDAPVRIDFLQEGAPPITRADTVAANAPLQLRVDDLVPPGAVSTVVHSTDAVPLAVERTMSWDGTGYGGHGGTAITPSTTWLFAEGSQGFFDTFLLLANDNDADAATIVRFLLEGGGVVTRNVTVQAHKRVTIYAGDIPELVDRSFGMEVTTGLGTPITAERAMYFPHSGARVFEGGHEAAGVTNTSRQWYLAEGATGEFFDSFVLLSNPNATPARTTLTYLLPSGETIAQTVDVPANGRSTINIETVDPRLENAAVSTIVNADIGIIVERSMYWPNIASGWREAHNSLGVTAAALRWGVSDVRVGGSREHQTYILLANPNSVPAEVQVRLLRSGAAPVTQAYTLPPTSRTNVFAADLAGAAGVYSAEVQVLNYQPIVVEKAMYWNSGSGLWGAGTGVVATPLPPPPR